jgi:hypothetical protein
MLNPSLELSQFLDKLNSPTRRPFYERRIGDGGKANVKGETGLASLEGDEGAHCGVEIAAVRSAVFHRDNLPFKFKFPIIRNSSTHGLQNNLLRRS